MNASRPLARWALLPFLLPALLLGPATPARAEDTPPQVAVPTGLPIQIDGRLLPAEWSAAKSLPVGTDGATLRLMQFRGTLLMAFETTEAWVLGDELLLTFAPANATKDIGAWTEGAVSIRYEPFKHDRAHLIVNRVASPSVIREETKVVTRSVFGRHASGTEFAVPLAFLGIEPGKTSALRCLAMLARTGKGRAIATWPAKLDVGARPGAHPLDLRSLARWGELAGLTKAEAQGAFSPTAWGTLLERQREITRRAREAYALMREMEEEWKIFKKQDERVDREIFGNLRWIAAHEPLADGDLLLMAKGHRMVNRYAEALALLDGLMGSPRKTTAHRALYERALVLRRLERFAEEAAAWDSLVVRSVSPASQRQYAQQAQAARALAERHAAAQAHRASDAKRLDLPRVEVETNRGTFVIELLRHDTPKAAAHFMALVRAGFYDHLRWHRVKAGQFAQMGDPGTRAGDCSLAGAGDSDTKVDVEQNERLSPWRGAVCFARKQGLYSNGSHVFCMTAPMPELKDDSQVPYTLFGWIVSGMSVVDRLEYCDEIVRARVIFDPPATTTVAKDGKPDPNSEPGEDK